MQSCFHWHPLITSTARLGQTCVYILCESFNQSDCCLNTTAEASQRLGKVYSQTEAELLPHACMTYIHTLLRPSENHGLVGREG